MEPTQVRIEIVLNTNGSVSINGPINDKILCYGLLESARKALDDYKPQEQPLVMLPTFNGPIRRG